MEKVIVYAGNTYRLNNKGRYYVSDDKDHEERLLHRRMWHDANGPIPAGFHVHHVDEDHTNNVLSNLEALPSKDHLSAHGTKLMADPARRAVAVAALDANRHKAAAWHASPEGVAWHKEHGKQTWEDRPLTTCACETCGGDFETPFPTRARFCSEACGGVAWRANNVHIVEATCEQCGGGFSGNKYRKQRFCGRKCAAVFNQGKRREAT